MTRRDLSSSRLASDDRKNSESPGLASIRARSGSTLTKPVHGTTCHEPFDAERINRQETYSQDVAGAKKGIHPHIAGWYIIRYECRGF